MANTTIQAQFGAAVLNHGNGVLVELRGELDMATAPLLADALGRARELDGQGIVVDMTDLSFMDCAGLRVLVSEHLRMTQDGQKLLVTNAGSFVRRVLGLTGYDHLTVPAEPPDE